MIRKQLLAVALTIFGGFFTFALVMSYCEIVYQPNGIIAW